MQYNPWAPARQWDRSVMSYFARCTGHDAMVRVSRIGIASRIDVDTCVKAISASSCFRLCRTARPNRCVRDASHISHHVHSSTYIYNTWFSQSRNLVVVILNQQQSNKDDCWATVVTDKTETPTTKYQLHIPSTITTLSPTELHRSLNRFALTKRPTRMFHFER